MEQQNHIQPPLEPQPTTPSERIPLLDILRGIAVFGILLVNIGSFKASAFPAMPLRYSTSEVDRWADIIVSFLIEGKFYPIFAFLFGFGFALQMDRLEARGLNPIRVMTRRLLVLLFIGLTHALFIWSGDVLFFYATAGFILMAFRRFSPRLLLALALSLWGVQLLCCGAPIGLLLAVISAADGATSMQQFNQLFASELHRLLHQADAVYSSGSYWQALQHRLLEWLQVIIWGYLVLMPNLLTMFWLGMYASKVRLFESLANAPTRWRVVAVLCLAVGFLVNAFYAQQVSSTQQIEISSYLTAFWLYLLGGPILAVGYVLGLALWLYSPLRQAKLRWLGAVGRMALTNYLLQSLLCTLIFYNYGLGLYGKVGTAAGLALSCLIFAAQALFSAWWVRRYRFGPVEWLWRTLTYGRRQPMALAEEKDR